MRTIQVFLLSAAALHAQCTYKSSSGQTTLTATYNPLAGSSTGSKAPAATTITSVPGTFLPSIPAAQYAAWKASINSAPVKFSEPAGIQVTPAPPAPKAPAASTPIVTTPTYSWQGLQQIANLAQPSPDMAAGPTDVIQAINGDPGYAALGYIALFTHTGTLVKQVAFETWFAPLLTTICPSGIGNCQIFDPVLRYDQLHGRFLFLASSRSLPDLRTGFTLLSVSNGASFNSGWKIWALNPATDAGTNASWGDFWRLSYDNNGVYLSGNLFSSLNAFQYAKIRVLKKSELYNPASTALTFSDFWNMVQTGDSQTAFSLAPVQQRGTQLTSNSALFVNAATVSTTAATFLTVWTLSNPLGGAPSLACSTITGAIAYTGPGDAPQSGGFATLDAGDNRVLKAIERGGFIYTARDTGYDCSSTKPVLCTTVTYDLINTSTMALTSQARIQNGYFFYPAFDVPAATSPGAPFAIGNLITGTTTSPTDGSVTFAGITNLKAGEDYFYPGGPLLGVPWGDYFGGAVDPVTGGLWVSGEYAKMQNTAGAVYGTWAGLFPMLTTQAFGDVPKTSSFFDYINVLSLWNVTSGCAAGPPALFCPGDAIARNQMAALIIKSLFGTSFSYTTAPYFTDVPSTDAYFPYIQKLRDLGITSGCATTRYCPNDPITRWSAAVLIIRAKMASLYGDNFTFPTTPYFTDVPPSDNGFPFVQKMYELGYTSGCAANTYCPERILTRQEAAAFLTRAFLN